MNPHRFLLSIICVLYQPAFAQEVSVMDARLTQASGDVTLRSQEGNAEGAVVPGEMALADGDRLHVGPGGRAEICVNAKTLIRLEPGSDFRIKKLSSNNIVFGLVSGTLLAKVKFDKREGSHLSVETPTSVTAVRGTEFVVQQEAWGSWVGVLDEGHVAVTPSLASVANGDRLRGQARGEVIARGPAHELLLHFNQETRVRRGLFPEKAHALQHLYVYKVSMAGMRDRVNLLHKHWNILTPKQRRLIRQAWINTHSRRARREQNRRRLLRRLQLNHPSSDS